MDGRTSKTTLTFGIAVLFAALASYSPAALDHVATPLNDLGQGLWKGSPGGLYPGGWNQKPAALEAAAINIGNDLQPLDASGNPDPVNGKIVMITIGVSNTTQESSVFVTLMNGDPAKNPQLEIVDCAQSSMDTVQWLSPTAQTWTTAYNRLTARGLTRQQVQVVWMKHAVIGAYNYAAFPLGPQYFRDDLEVICRNMKTNFVNSKMVYLSSRTRAHTDSVAPGSLSPEPFAYELGWGVRWLIEEQQNGTDNLNWDQAQGTVVAPLLLWGPYLWADGAHPRSDGFVWLESDTIEDKVHPSVSGRAKVAEELKAFFKTDPSATPWFLKSDVTGQAPTASISSDTTGGPAGVVVHFTANAHDPDGAILDYRWTYDDGCFSAEANPTKSFPAPGDYTVCLTVTDDQGNTAAATRLISVGMGKPVAVFTDDFDYGLAPATINFDASSSTPGDAPIVSYAWDFGDGNTASGPVASHTFESNGDYVVALTVTDSNSVTGGAQEVIHIGPLDVSPTGDLSGNEIVDLTDYGMLANWWGTSDLSADIVSDNIIDCNDLKVMCSNWLHGVLYAHTEPIAYYKLNDGGGNLAIEATGNGDTAVVSGCTWVTGKAGGALSFDGRDDIVTIPDTPKYDLPSGTWSLWIRTNGVWQGDGASGDSGEPFVVQGVAAIMARHSSSGSRGGVGLLINPPSGGGTLKAQVKSSSTTVCDVVGTTNVINQAWHHVAVVYNRASGGQILLYLDGASNGSGAASAAWTFDYENINLADSPDNYFWEEFQGEIDDVQIYNRALSPTEIEWLYNHPGSSL